MAIPKLDNNFRKAIVEELQKAGGEARRKDIIEKLAQRFRLTPAERELKDQWGRIFDFKVTDTVVQLRKQGLIEPKEKSGRGIYRLTPAGWEGAGRTERRRELLKVRTAEEATEVALSFLTKHYRFIPQRPIEAVREDNVWLVEIDVGLLRTRIAKLKIDAKTATILEYTIPPEAV